MAEADVTLRIADLPEVKAGIAQLAAERDEAIRLLQEMRRAIKDEGPNPKSHRVIMAKHRKEWPTLWRSIDRLLVHLEQS